MTFSRLVSPSRWPAALVFSSLGAVVISLTLCAILTACNGVGGIGPAPDSIIARVGDRVLLASDVMASLPPRLPTERVANQRRETVDQWIRTELLAQEGYKRGIDKQPSTRLAIDRVVAQGLEREVNGGIANITQADIDAYYNAHADSFRMPARTRIQVIVLAAPTADAKKHTEAQQTANTILQQLRDNDQQLRPDRPADGKFSPYLFGSLARKYSGDAGSRMAGGDIGFLSDTELEQRYAPELVPAVQALKIEDPYVVVEAPAGFYIVKLIARAPAKEDTPADAGTATLIRNRLLAQRSQGGVGDLIASLRKQTDVVIDEKRLAEIQPPTPSPVLSVNGHSAQ